MNKLNMAKLFKDAQSVLSKHSPAILTGIGIAGMITTTVLAVKATPKALKLMEIKREELDLEEDEKLTPIETVKTTWKCYIPAAVTGAVSVACLVGANSVSARRNAALMAAYNISATALEEYQEKVVETVGEKKERAIRDKVSEDHIKNNPVERTSVFVTSDGMTRFYDDISKRRFTSDIAKVKTIQNELNARMLDGDDYVSLNDFYYELGLEPIEFGDDLGWTIRNGRSGMISIDVTSAHVDTDGQPCIDLRYAVKPCRGYDQ